MYQVKTHYRVLFLKVPMKTYECQTIDDACMAVGKELKIDGLLTPLVHALVNEKNAVLITNFPNLEKYPKGPRKILGKRLTVVEV